MNQKERIMRDSQPSYHALVKSIQKLLEDTQQLYYADIDSTWAFYCTMSRHAHGGYYSLTIMRTHEMNELEIVIESSTTLNTTRLKELLCNANLGNVDYNTIVR